jgi:hypothetical protein
MGARPPPWPGAFLLPAPGAAEVYLSFGHRVMHGADAAAALADEVLAQARDDVV